MDQIFLHLRRSTTEKLVGYEQFCSGLLRLGVVDFSKLVLDPGRKADDDNQGSESDNRSHDGQLIDNNTADSSVADKYAHSFQYDFRSRAHAFLTLLMATMIRL